MESNYQHRLPAEGMSESGKEFLQEFNTATIPAVDTPYVEVPAAKTEAGYNPLDGPPESPPPPPEAENPIFEDIGGAGADAGSPAPAAKPLTDKKSEAKLLFIIKMIDKLQAKGFVRMAKELEEQEFRFDDEEMEMLVDAWMPYMKEHGGNIPDWIEAAFTTIWVFGSRFIKAYDLRMINSKNEQLSAAPTMQRTVGELVAIRNPNRKDYILATTKIGYYQNNAKTGKYLRKELLTEKASLEDLEMLLRDNDAETVRRAFPNAVIPDAAA